MIGSGGRFQKNIERLRSICLEFPETSEKEAWGDPTFRIRDKIFAMHKCGDGHSSVWCKAGPGAQDVLVNGDPGRFFVPPYVGHKGWIGVRLDEGVDWELVAGLIADSYVLIAPKRLSAQLTKG